MSFISKLIHRADSAMTLGDAFDADLAALVAQDLIQEEKPLAVESTSLLIDRAAMKLDSDRTYLIGTIERLTEELRQTEVSLTALRAAQEVLAGSPTRIPG